MSGNRYGREIAAAKFALSRASVDIMQATRTLARAAEIDPWKLAPKTRAKQFEEVAAARAKFVQASASLISAQTDLEHFQALRAQSELSP